MNPSSYKPQQSSQEELHSNGPNELRSVRQWTIDGEGATDSLPNEVLLMIFRFLAFKDLLIAEQVCLRWKAIVNTTFATAKTLRLHGKDNLKKMKRFGSSVKYLDVQDPYRTEDNIDWIDEIVNAFPNLMSITLSSVQISNESLKVLSVKCGQITTMSLSGCSVPDADIGIVLMGFPRLKHLILICTRNFLGECFRELGSNIEHLILFHTRLSVVGISHILSRGLHLKTIEVGPGFDCDANSFTRFCKKSQLQSLHINQSKLSRELFLPISYLSLLDTLMLMDCPAVDSEVLIRISLGCPNLKLVALSKLPLVCDRGLKALAQCRHLTALSLYFIVKVTDESLFEIAKAGLLKALVILKCGITDRGVAAILAQCPHLRCLDVNCCSGVGDSTVDAAIEAVESRDRSGTLKRSIAYDQWNLIMPRHTVVRMRHYLLCLYVR